MQRKKEMSKREREARKEAERKESEANFARRAVGLHVTGHLLAALILGI